MNKKPLLLVGIIAIFFCAFLVICDCSNYRYFEPSVIVIDAYMCNGPDPITGIPSPQQREFDGRELNLIFVCIEIQPVDNASIHVNWRLASRKTSFYVSASQRVQGSPFLYFSLGEIQTTSRDIYYLEEFLDAGFLPPGEYSVKIEQAREALAEIHFIIR